MREGARAACTARAAFKKPAGAHQYRLRTHSTHSTRSTHSGRQPPSVRERRPTRYTDRDAVAQSEPARASPPAFARKRCSHPRSTARRFRPLVMCEAEKAGGSARGYHSCTLERTSRARADAYSCSWAPRTTRRTCDAKYSTHAMPLAQSHQADRLDLPAVGFRRSWGCWDCRCSRSGCCSRGSGNGRRGGHNRR